jgi:predicted nucleic acid-binding Zn ribbon protein
MSDILFKCSGCGLNLSVSEAMAGQSFVCPTCQGPIQAPDPILRFLCPSCCNDLSAPYELRNELVSCPLCEAGLRLPPKLVVTCPACSVNLEIDDEYYLQLAGKGVECPECGAQVPVPGPVLRDQAQSVEAAVAEEPEKPESGIGDPEPEQEQLEQMPEQQQEEAPKKEEQSKPVAQFEPGFAQKTMKLDEFMDDISQANTVKEGKCPYCGTPLKKLYNRAYVCKRCNRVIRTVKRTIH